MRRYLIAALVVGFIILLQISVMHTRRTVGDLVKAADRADQKKRPTPTPRPTPRPNMNDGGGVYERGNANSNDNTSAGDEQRSRKARRRSHRSNPNIGTTDTGASPEASTVGESNAEGVTTGRRWRAGSHRRRVLTPSVTGATTRGRETTAGTLAEQAVTSDTPADLSGTYAGLVSDGAIGVTGEEATLTITGDRCTLESASLNYSGRFIVNTTRGYNAVTMELGPPTAGQSYAPFISISARRVGANHLILSSVTGERRRFSFMSSRANAVRKR